ncbi:Uncharacterised protein [Vibrio cholerae]|nr:Uncharacterised protein [Vibrio cholerae]CSI80130.1 Uncharacterised protein [Vibrio cholerae]
MTQRSVPSVARSRSAVPLETPQNLMAYGYRR